MRHLVGARVQLVGISIGLSNQIRRVLKTFGLRTGSRAGRVFETRVRDQIAALDCKLIEAVKGEETCRLPMTCPGVGVVVAASFSAAVEASG